MDVARERGLRDLEAAAAQLAAELVLVRHQGVRYEFSNCVVALKFH